MRKIMKISMKMFTMQSQISQRMRKLMTLSMKMFTLQIQLRKFFLTWMIQGIGTGQTKIYITDFLVERGPKRDNNVIFPKDKCDRCFSSKHYFRELPNGEKQERKWLVYSVSLDKVFCFCCKLFAKKHLVGQLADEGVNDWHNISDRLKSHERSRYHIGSMTSWMELAKRLKLKLTIDASLKEQINQEKEHWKQVLERILAVVKRLGKNNLAFCGDSEKLYEKNNGIFLQMIELLAEFDSTMQKTCSTY
ncbi:uncharacterized protein LOC133727793 [Rosa rugosa]|uniref:uncharacterized protein LOC133727793 n=1 Tax=Rosa rugosa TaxID=74645 RepID=UPI002B405928|nr:uncharacterized protein LOC133727793 [Rosa rugosa]